MPPAQYYEPENIAAIVLYVVDDICAEEPQDYPGAMSRWESGQMG